ncbi:MAG: hypothetical protein GWN58_25155, partial [Anaerolineae bacterium]|nr:hypothetical protein [Anaerolineae bacterium]
LHEKDIVQRPIIGFRPQVETGARIDKLRSYPYLAIALSYTAFEDIRNTQLFPDALQGGVAALERE